MVDDSSTYWKNARVELRAAGFEPDRAAKTSAVVTIASACCRVVSALQIGRSSGCIDGSETDMLHLPRAC